MPRAPISPTFPTTATSTSSNMPLFPFQPSSSPSPSSQTSLTRVQRTAEARDAFNATLRAAGAHLDGELKARASDLYENAQVIEKQDQDLRDQTRGMREENERMEEVIREQRQGLLELGIQTRSQVQREREYGLSEGENVPEHYHDVEDDEELYDVSGGDIPGLIPGLGDIGNLDDFLKGVENDLLILEETCRILEDGEDDMYDDGTAYVGQDAENSLYEEGPLHEPIRIDDSNFDLPPEASRNEDQPIAVEASAPVSEGLAQSNEDPAPPEAVLEVPAACAKEPISSDHEDAVASAESAEGSPLPSDSLAGHSSPSQEQMAGHVAETTNSNQLDGTQGDLIEQDTH